MNSVLMKLSFVLSSVLISALASPTTAATGQETGVIVCMTDKWDEKEVAKGHKIADYTGRCITVPHDTARETIVSDCIGKYEYMPDGTWKGVGTGTDHFKSGDTRTFTWDEGSDLKEYRYTNTGGTGKFQNAKGGGTYFYVPITETVFSGTYKDKSE
ncbi:MAG: hypothetical protein QM780_02865 [Hyphomicrobium sp.]|uniref:hypothetical protein n=1 Tax=Hyphomicrobium sp. TaxID=82 RepID=UPI0039E45494